MYYDFTATTRKQNLHTKYLKCIKYDILAKIKNEIDFISLFAKVAITAITFYLIAIGFVILFS